MVNYTNIVHLIWSTTITGIYVPGWRVLGWLRRHIQSTLKHILWTIITDIYAMFGADVCLVDYAAHRINIRAYSVGRWTMSHFNIARILGVKQKKCHFSTKNKKQKTKTKQTDIWTWLNIKVVFIVYNNTINCMLRYMRHLKSLTLVDNFPWTLHMLKWNYYL